MLKFLVVSVLVAVASAQVSKLICDHIAKNGCEKLDKLDPHRGPHCAEDGVTYNSTCQKNQVECKMAKTIRFVAHTHCDDIPTLPPLMDKCSEQWAEKYLKCDETSKPLCGSDEKTYTNYCEYHQARCDDVAQFGPFKAPKVYVKARGVKCEDIPTRPPPTDFCKDYWLKQDCTKSRMSVFTKMCDQNQNVYANRCYFYQAYCKDDTLRSTWCKYVRPTTDGSGEGPQ